MPTRVIDNEAHELDVKSDGSIDVNVGSGGNDLSVDSTGAAKTVEKRAATAALTRVNDSASSVTVLAANAARLGARVVNDSTSILYLKFGATATTSSFTHKLVAGETLIEDQYTGIMDGIWSADASGAAQVTELTA